MNPILILDHLLPLLAVVLVAGGLLAWRSAAKAPLGVRFLLLTLRLLALAGLGLIALNPGHWKEQVQAGKIAWGLLIDRSLSMSTPDEKNNSRWAEANRLAQKAMAIAAHKDNVRIYTFADQLDPSLVDLNRLAEFEPDGGSTDIPGSVLAALNACRAGGAKLTGLLLLSDGRQVAPTGCDGAAILAQSQDAPIFALALGGGVVNQDLSITADRRQYVTFVGQKFKIAAQARSERLGSISPSVQLIDPAGNVIAGQKIVFTNDGVLPVQFEVTPKERGYFQYRIRLPVWQNETSDANNEASVAVVVLENKIRIFMAEGTPFWDTKFLTQMIRQQPNLELTSIYRLSSERFFKVETDAERVSNAPEPEFPDDDVLFAKYDMIIFGRGVEYFLTPERIQRLKRFVGDQGGCIVFARGKPYSGSFAEMEMLEPAEWGDVIIRPFRLRPTQAGEYAGLFGDMLPDRNQPVWTQLPLLKHAHHCARLKAFTQVLAEGVVESAEESAVFSFPLLLSQRYGKGIVVTVNAEDLWQWFFFPTVSAASEVYRDFWIQLFTWAGTYSEFLPSRHYALHLSETLVYPDLPVRARISQRSVLPAQKTPLIRVMHENTSVLEMPAASAGDDLRWDALFSLKQPGNYRVELAGLDDEAARGVYATLSVRAPPSENDNRSADPAFLKKLAEASAGRLIKEDELESVIKSFEPVKRPKSLGKAEWAPLWNNGWFLGLLLFLFGMEWFLRRRTGLL